MQGRLWLLVPVACTGLLTPLLMVTRWKLAARSVVRDEISCQLAEGKRYRVRITEIKPVKGKCSPLKHVSGAPLPARQTLPINCILHNCVQGLEGLFLSYNEGFVLALSVKGRDIGPSGDWMLKSYVESLLWIWSVSIMSKVECALLIVQLRLGISVNVSCRAFSTCMDRKVH